MGLNDKQSCVEVYHPPEMTDSDKIDALAARVLALELKNRDINWQLLQVQNKLAVLLADNEAETDIETMRSDIQGLRWDLDDVSRDLGSLEDRVEKVENE